MSITARRTAGRKSTHRRTRADRFDRRTFAWRRRQEVVAAYHQALGLTAAPEGTLELKIAAAAEMRCVAEVARSRYLAGAKDTTLNDVVRIENTAARLERALGIPAKPAAPARRTLRDYLAGGKASAASTEKAGGSAA